MLTAGTGAWEVRSGWGDSNTAASQGARSSTRARANLVLNLGQLFNLPGSGCLNGPRDSSFVTNTPRDFDRWETFRNVQLSY